MLTSHRRSLQRAHSTGELAGQLAARELERIGAALRHSSELTDDVAPVLEAVA